MDLTVMQIHAEHWNTDLAMRLGVNRKFIDYGIYKPSGFVFTARPRLKGLDDPHPVRAFVVDGKAGPVPIPRLPDMIEVEVAPAVALGQMPTLRWDDGQRHNSVFDFMRAYRTAFPESVFTECWESAAALGSAWSSRVAALHGYALDQKVPEEERLLIIAKHKQESQLAAVEEAAAILSDGEDIDNDLRWLLRRLRKSIESCGEDDDKLLELARMREMRHTLESLAKLRGMFSQKIDVQIDLGSSPQFLLLRQIILRVLDQHPEAKADFLREMNVLKVIEQ